MTVPRDCRQNLNRHARRASDVDGRCRTMSRRASDVQRVVLEAYDALAKNGKPNAGQYTTLCGFVMTRGDDEDDDDSSKGVVVALGTGCKCVPAHRRDSEGYVVADSHAEVIARRAFVRWLMEQARAAAMGERSSAFERNDEDDDDGDDDSEAWCDAAAPFVRARRRGALVRMRTGVEFHMYCSQPPCGDASVFDRPDARRRASRDDTKASISGRDGEVLKRAKTIGAGGGGAGATGAKLLVAPSGAVDPERGELVQRLGAARLKPGRGEPCDCMSCSDKLCRWCAVGFEGALMSSVVREPIFMTTIVVAAPKVFDDLGAHVESGQDVDDVRANVLDALRRAIETRVIHVAGASNLRRRPELSCAPPSDASLASYEGMTNGDRIACPTTISHIHRARNSTTGVDAPVTEVTLGARGYKLGYKHVPASTSADASLAGQVQNAAKFAAQICPRFTFARFIDVITTFATEHPGLAARNAITQVVVGTESGSPPTYADVKRAAKRLSGYGAVDLAQREPKTSPLRHWVDSARKISAYDAFTV